MAAINKLSAKAVENARQPGKYYDGAGLVLVITKTGTKSWFLRYQRDGRERWHGLGPLHTVSLKEARERARKARLQLLDDIDPIDAKRAAKAARALASAQTITFEEAARKCHIAKRDGWKNAKHSAQFLSTLKAYVFPVFGKVAVADVDAGLIIRALEPIWKEKPETATRVRQRIEAVLNWAATNGYRPQGVPNPARWKGHLEHTFQPREKVRKVKHHAALPFAELPAFMADLSTREALAARALAFTILTVARTGEVVDARWPEIDLKAKVWTVPAERMKAKREHRVPLSDRAVELLRNLPGETDNPYVFISATSKGRPLSNMAMLVLLKRMGRSDLTVHGFRSAFRDWTSERTAFPHEVCEAALAHTIKNKTEAAYRRGDLLEPRRPLMDAWSRFCESPAPAIEGDNVRSIRSA